MTALAVLAAWLQPCVGLSKTTLNVKSIIAVAYNAVQFTGWVYVLVALILAARRDGQCLSGWQWQRALFCAVTCFYESYRASYIDESESRVFKTTTLDGWATKQQSRLAHHTDVIAKPHTTPFTIMQV